MAAVRDHLLARLVALGLHYPDLHLGQLMRLTCKLAGESMSHLADAEAIQTIDDHGRELDPNNRGLEIRPGLLTLTPARAKLVDALRKAGEQHPDVTIGQSLLRFATLAGVDIGEAHDQQLADVGLRSGVTWFEDYAKRLNSKRKKLACPCCYYDTLGERSGFYICPVCNWEDDGQDDEDASDFRGGPNGALTLTVARENFRSFGACDLESRNLVRTPLADELNQDRNE